MSVRVKRTYLILIPANQKKTILFLSTILFTIDSKQTDFFRTFVFVAGKLVYVFEEVHEEPCSCAC